MRYSESKRLISLIVLCSLSAAALGLSIKSKSHPKSPVPVVLKTGNSAQTPASRLQIAVPKVGVAEYSARVIRENPATPIPESGRPDPFAKLPEEMELSIAFPVSTVQPELARINPSPGPPGVHEPLPPVFTVRGIIRGQQTAAFIETSGQPGYRRVGVGEPLYGGRVVEIGENGIVIAYQGKQVFYSMGE